MTGSTNCQGRPNGILEVSRAALSVMKAGVQLAREIERTLTDVELTLPQFNVLMELAASPEGELAMHAVTDRLVTTPPSLSRLTSRMRDAGLVIKERSPGYGLSASTVGANRAGRAAVRELLRWLGDVDQAADGRSRWQVSSDE